MSARLLRESPMVRVHAAGQLAADPARRAHELLRSRLPARARMADDAIVISCLDNLLKGAAGQAVQNLNVMCGWNETEGLI